MTIAFARNTILVSIGLFVGLGEILVEPLRHFLYGKAKLEFKQPPFNASNSRLIKEADPKSASKSLE